jgi:DNA polymerase III alpha subunit (gram-positive type)
MSDLYGEEIDIGILNRYYSEKKFLAENNHEWFLDVLSNLAEDAKEHNENITALGTMGCLFVAYIFGITKVNPLELHYLLSEVQEGGVY